MSIVRAAGFDAFLRRPARDLRAILIYGQDEIRVGDLARRAVRQFAGALDDPFAVVRLDDAQLVKDKALLADEVAALPLLGTRRVVWVSNADQGFSRAAEAVLKDEAGGNLIVAEAGVLPKGSPLRSLFESAERAVVVPVYEANDEDLAGLVQSAVEACGLRIRADAVARFVDLLRRDQGAAVQEVEKLACYCVGRSEITLADVEAVTSAGGEEALDELVDAVFGGDVEKADARFSGLLAAGVDAGRIATVLHGHGVRLADLRLKVQTGQQVETAVRSARPPIFFARVNAVVAQVNALPLETLVQANQTLAAAVERSRTQSALAAAIVGRAAMSVARHARSQRFARV